MDVNAVIAERFGIWGERFRRERAIPVLVLGVNATNKTAVITVAEGTSRGEIRNALCGALALIDRGEVEYVDQPEASKDLHR